MSPPTRASGASRRRALDDRFDVRTAQDRADVERVAEFNGAVHGPEVAALTRCLFLRHPAAALDDLFFVQDVRTGEVVSSLCLIPWLWRLDGVEVLAAEMGVVGTSQAYRRQGLVSAQLPYFRGRLAERGCLLSHIQGIPYFYRQYGYEYALPLEGGLRLEVRDIPDGTGEGYTFRLAGIADLPILEQLYEALSRDLAIHAVRDSDTWRYLLTHAQAAETACERWIVEQAGGAPAGYFALPHHHFGEELVVSEVSRLNHEACWAVLRYLKHLVAQRRRPAIRLNLPAKCALARVARSIGAHDLGTYQWQVHIPSPAALLHQLRPALERRIAASCLSGLTRNAHISLYRTTLELRFESGRLTSVADIGFTDREAIRIPPRQFVPLVLGYRTREELETWHPDVSVPPAERLFADVLFPKLDSFLYTTY